MSMRNSRFSSSPHCDASNQNFGVVRLAKIVQVGNRLRKKRNTSESLSYKQQRVIYESQVERQNVE